MKESKTITIVTPVLNGEKYIRETMESVLRQSAVQSGRVNLQYLVMDGGSEDGTLAIIDDLMTGAITLHVAPDNGLYHALANGLKSVCGDVVAYLNCGDFYHPAAFDIVLDVMEQHPQVVWLTGMVVEYNDRSQVVDCWTPPVYRRALFECGLYGTFLDPVQQESTFWSSALLRGIDYGQLASCRLAGDFYLWQQFARNHELYIVQGQLGGFRKHIGQLSSDLGAYRDELRRLAKRRPGPFDYMLGCQEKFRKYLPMLVKKKLGQGRLLTYNHRNEHYE